jgi:hypothetical protein
VNSVNTYLRFKISFEWDRVLSLKCVLIAFTIPNLSLVCICKYFRTGFWVQNNALNLCVHVVEFTKHGYFVVKKLVLNHDIKAIWYTKIISIYIWIWNKSSNKTETKISWNKKISLKYMNPIFFYKKTKFKKTIDNKILLCEYSQWFLKTYSSCWNLTVQNSTGALGAGGGRSVIYTTHTTSWLRYPIIAENAPKSKEKSVNHVWKVSYVLHWEQILILNLLFRKTKLQVHDFLKFTIYFNL